MTQPISDSIGIGSAYRGHDAASQYVDRRFVSELNRLLHDRQAHAINQAIKQSNPRRVLEIAPGPGRLTRDIHYRGSFVCLEFNQGMIGHGQPCCEEAIGWVRGDGFRIPLQQGFDLVYSFRFVRHFQLANRSRLYAEIRRVLHPGGLFLMDAINRRVSLPFREAHPEDYLIYDELYHPEELRSELESSGLELLGMEPVQKHLRLQYRSQILLGPRANWLNRMVIRGLENFPSRDGLEWIVTCRRV